MIQESGRERGETLCARFDARAGRMPDAVAFVTQDLHWSNGDLQDLSRRVAGTFRSRGLGPGDRVALHLRNGPELVIAYLACLRCGAIAVPLNPRLKAPELRTLCGKTEPALYIGDPGLGSAIAEIFASRLPVAGCFFVGHPTRNETNAHPWAELITGPRGEDTAVAWDEPTILLATSGTTGESKLVVWTQRTLIAIVDHFHDEDLFADDVILVQMPMTHAGGLLQTLHGLACGSRLVLVTQPDSDAVLDAVAEQGCTSMLGTPAFYAELIRHQRNRPRDLSSLRLCVVSGDVCPSEIERSFETVVGVPLYSRWGATEDVATAVRGRVPGPFVQPSYGRGWMVVPAAGSNASANGSGELWTRSAGTTPGYWRADGEMERLAEGWFRSGDLVREESDGQLRYLGRMKDLIVRAGSNISPVEIEQALLRDDAVVEVAVVGVADPDLGERVGAILVLRDGCGPGDARAAVQGLSAVLADHKLPELFCLTDALARNALGKIDRRQLRDTTQYWQPVGDRDADRVLWPDSRPQPTSVAER